MQFSADIEPCLQTLRSGGVILYPTDTIWGLGCDATNPRAVEKIYAIKKRAESKALIVLMATERDIINYSTAVDLSVFDYLETVTKPTTIIYSGATGLADNLLADDGSIAIRLTKDPFCNYLIKRFQKPIVSTSANISGTPSPENFMQINDYVKNAVDYVVKYRQNDLSPTLPSAIVQWNNGALTVIRP